MCMYSDGLISMRPLFLLGVFKDQPTQIFKNLEKKKFSMESCELM